MSKLKQKAGLTGMAIIVLLVAGCIYSATFVISETFKFDPGEDFYSHRVDLTTDATWNDHKDKIDIIETVGFVLYITSGEPDVVYFSAYIDEATGAGPDPSAVPTTATVIMDSLAISPGNQVISYVQSLKVLTNVDALKKMGIKGVFDFYGTSTGSDGDTFKVDSVTAIVTLSAS